jgi:glucose/arabinose dehydrogenase
MGSTGTMANAEQTAVPGARQWLAALGAAAALALTLAIGVDSAGAVTSVHVANFDSPTYATAPSTDTRRLFVTERDGRVRVVLDGEKRQRPFLNITEEVGGNTEAGEAGLLSMAFAPDYAQSGRFYVYYTKAARAGEVQGPIRVDELRRDPDNPNLALEGSRRKVIAIPHPDHDNHVGGTIQFGPDGHLFMATGDGGGSGDVEREAQDLNSLLGKLLRIDPTPADGTGYDVPANPFVGTPGRDEIFALGLRNPFRFSFDRLTGELAIGDVGQMEREEVDFGTTAELSGANFGWNCFEGTKDYDDQNFDPDCELSFGTHEPPVHERFHSDGVCSITGGVVVHHPSLATLEGDYVYGDFCQQGLRAVELDSTGASNDRAIGVDIPSVVGFGEDGRGRVHAVSLDGPVYRLRD